MKGAENFKKVVKSYLEEFAQKDETFAKAFFDINEKIKVKTTTNTVFPIKEKNKKRNDECPRYRINSLEILTQQ